MDFGHLEGTEGIDFSLLEIDARSKVFLTKQKQWKKGRFDLRIGLPVWSEPKWADLLFPRSASGNEYLAYYAQRFNSVELCGSYYHIPSEEQIETWKSAVGADFLFYPKMPQKISHGGSLREGLGMAKFFFDRILLFKDNLGPCFLQLPPSYQAGRLGDLEAFLRALPRKIKLAVEFRHPSWFVQGYLGPQVFELLQFYNVSPVITDVAGRRNLSHMSFTNSEVMIRYVATDDVELERRRYCDWLNKLAELKEWGLKMPAFFVHHKENEKSAKRGIAFRDLGARLDDEIERLLPPLQPEAEQQLSLF